jgi:hypothetical protein
MRPCIHHVRDTATAVTCWRISDPHVLARMHTPIGDTPHLRHARNAAAVPAEASSEAADEVDGDGDGVEGQVEWDRRPGVPLHVEHQQHALVPPLLLAPRAARAM